MGIGEMKGNQNIHFIKESYARLTQPFWRLGDALDAESSEALLLLLYLSLNLIILILSPQQKEVVEGS